LAFKRGNNTTFFSAGKEIHVFLSLNDIGSRRRPNVKRKEITLALCAFEEIAQLLVERFGERAMLHRNQKSIMSLSMNRP
jgi:hypothetical protein